MKTSNSFRLSTVSRHLAIVAILGLVFSPEITRAAWIGATAGTTNDAAHSYLTLANWSGAAVENTFSPTLTATTTIYFSGNHTTTGTFNVNYTGNAALTMLGGGVFDAAGGATAAADRTIFLGGDFNVDIVSANQTVNLGSTVAGQGLAFDLNGATRTFTIATSDSAIFNNGILGSGGLIKAGNGTMALVGSGTYDGITTVNAGGLSVRHNSALGSTTGGTVVNGTANLANLQLQGGITVTGETLSIVGDGTGGSVASDGVFRNISGTNTWGGNITVGTSGTTRISAAAGTMNITGNITMSTTAGDQLVLNGDGIGNISGNLTGASRLTKSSIGGGTWNLSGTNTYNGSTTVSNGTLHFAKQVSLYNNDTSKWTSANIVVGATGILGLSVGGTGEFTVADVALLSGLGGYTAGANLSLDTTNAAGGIFTMSSTIAGANLGLIKRGTGTLELTTNNTFGRTLQVLSGTLNISGANAYTGSTTLAGGTTIISNNSALGTSAAGTSITGTNASLQLQGNITVTGENLAFSNAATLGTGALVNIGGNNTWTGNLTAATDTANNVIRIVSNAGKLTISGNVTTSSANEQLVIGQGDGITEYTGIIGGPAAITKSTTGTGTLILAGLNTYTGATSISNGTVLVQNNAPSGANGAFGNATSNIRFLPTNVGPTAAAILIDGAFTIGRNIDVQAGSAATGTLGGNGAFESTFSGTITLGRPTIFSQAANGKVNFTGALTGAQPVTVSGAGVVVFGGTSKAYTGTTLINSGATLQVNTAMTSTTSPFTVNGTLGGTGSIASVVDIGATGRLAPGASVGTLTLTNTLNLVGGSKFTFELVAPGTSDLVSMSGSTLALSGQQFTDFTFTALTGMTGGTYTLFDAGTITGTLGAITTGVVNYLGTDYAASIQLVGNDLVLNVAPVPEPGTLALAALGVALLIPAYRRRKRQSR